MSDGVQRPERLPAWPQVREMLGAGTPQAIVLDGTPAVQLIVDGEHDLMRLRCEATGKHSQDEFEELEELDVAWSGGDDWLEISTHASQLFPYFLAFAATVADDVQLEGSPVRAAVQQSLRLFRRLVRDTSLLSPERQLGLLGELWVLERLIGSRGAGAIETWLGPDAEAHDFRCEDVELEVKSTRRKTRQHIINGLDQLNPSVDASLYLISLQFTAAGAIDSGDSLAAAIERTRGKLAQFGQNDAFDAVLLDRFDISRETEHRYTERLKLRSDPHLIPITESAPRLVRQDLDRIHRDEMHRVVDAEYVLDCDGLGVPDGSPEFLAVIQ